MSAVSKNVTPTSRAASTTARVADSSMRPPKLLQPRPTTVTSRGPSLRVRILRPYRAHTGSRAGSIRIVRGISTGAYEAERDAWRPAVARARREALASIELCAIRPPLLEALDVYL